MEDFEARLPIELGQFLKLTSLVETGGHARELIQEGDVFVNGEVNTHRRHKLNNGDVVEIEFPDGGYAKIRVIAE